MNDKQRVAIHAASLIEDGMLVGLGTGSTANYFIEELARRRREEDLYITTVSSSNVSAIKAYEVGLPLVAMEQISKLDVYVDGADEITADMILLKGRGYDLVREKLLARAADKFYVVADQSKLVSRIGENFPIPIEVMPFAWQLVKNTLESLGGKGELRPNTGGDGLAITSYGSLVLDIQFDVEVDIQTLNAKLNAVPGVVEHGVFYQLATGIFIVNNDEVEERWRTELPASMY